MKEELEAVSSRVPIPDPTLLTTAALKLSIENLKELLETKIVHSYAELHAQVNFTNVLKEEKFKELHDRLDLIEQRRLELKEDSKNTLNLALNAQQQLIDQRNKCNEEATQKSEASFTKQIEAIRKEGVIERGALSGRIDALKERIDRGRGKEENQESQQKRESWVIPLIVVAIIALSNLIVNLFSLHK